MTIKSSKRQELDLDRVVMELTGSKHPDESILVKDLLEHHLVVATTGVGKSSVLGYYLAKAIMNAKGLAPEEKIGMIIFQYKDDTRQWLDWAEEFGRAEDVIRIGPQDRDVFNVLEAYRHKETSSAVDLLTTLSGLSLTGANQNKGEAYWREMNRQRLHRLITLAKLSGESLSIAKLYHLHSTAPQLPEQLEDEEFKANSYCWQMLQKAFHHVGSDHPEFQLVEQYFIREMPYMNDRTQSSILSMTSGTLEPYVSSPLLNRLFCGGTTISLDQLLGGKIVILDLAIKTHEYAGKLSQLMFKHVLQKRIEDRDLTQLPCPVIFHLDEYAQFISPYDALFLSTARSSRAGFLAMIQNISGLFAQVGGDGFIAQENVNSLLALFNHKFFMAQNNHVTNEFAAKTIGMGLRSLNNTSMQLEEFQGNSGYSESYHYQVMPVEFTTLRRGGKAHQGIVDVILMATGKLFSNGKNHLRLRFKQPWMR